MSSFHLWWVGLPASPILEVHATLEVLQPPQVSRLYFWALQVSFSDGHDTLGAAHTGLQWNPNHPRSRAVNWGGYAVAADTSSVLTGSQSSLPGRPNDQNTRDYQWEPGRAYTFRISRSTAGWRSEVTDNATGVRQVIRDLFVGGDRLTNPVVWSEVFANCDDPTATVRWSGLELLTADGSVAAPHGAQANYPRVDAGDCTNTDSHAVPGGFVQSTRSQRTTTAGQVLPYTT